MSEPAVVASGRWRLPDLPAPRDPIPSVDQPTMLAADRIATDRVGVSLLQMMENAGLQLAELTRMTLGGTVSGRLVVVLAGTGNNAGGGMVAARRLAGWGADVHVIFARPMLRLRPGPCAQIEPMLAAGVRAAVAGHDRSHAEIAGELMQADAVLDALIGYSLQGPPDDVYAPLIELAYLGRGPVISLDIPSGIDPTSGERPGSAVRADATLALALPKTGMSLAEGRRYSGVGFLADIGLPASIFTELGVRTGAWFEYGPIVRLRLDRPAAAQPAEPGKRDHSAMGREDITIGACRSSSSSSSGRSPATTFRNPCPPRRLTRARNAAAGSTSVCVPPAVTSAAVTRRPAMRARTLTRPGTP